MLPKYESIKKVNTKIMVYTQVGTYVDFKSFRSVSQTQDPISIFNNVGKKPRHKFLYNVV